ncbi:hypothetical protein [Nocardia sp. NPDC052566]|uniref:hypothetical protein n=1 Tax=Nocardia sp. NPDC052566 TaxID=3364330 RepID=UPI0037C98332
MAFVSGLRVQDFEPVGCTLVGITEHSNRVIDTLLNPGMTTAPAAKTIFLMPVTRVS